MIVETEEALFLRQVDTSAALVLSEWIRIVVGTWPDLIHSSYSMVHMWGYTINVVVADE